MLVHAKVDFTKKLQDWDGFGFNYVQTSQTGDYQKDPQEYGGFSIIDEKKRREILDLIFGDNGYKPNIIKMFLDPLHQKTRGGPFDHKVSTEWMRYFVREGMKMSKGKYPIDMITSCYQPPDWVTVQKFMRGRDPDPNCLDDLAQYYISWVKFLREEEKFPMNYISLHNEGEDFSRWPEDGSTSGGFNNGADYDMYWSPEFVAAFIPRLRKALDKAGLSDVGVTPGECSNWTRFYNWGHADAIADDPEALKALGLITSHGFTGGLIGQEWYGDGRSVGIDELRKKRPELHAWTTSYSWGNMDAQFVAQTQNLIYSAKCNAVIPWAGIQRPTHWYGGDPNPGNAIQIYEDGTYEIRKGYYYYKQVCPIGRKGMDVVKVYSENTATCIMAFAKGKSDAPNAFVLINTSPEDVRFDLNIIGGGENYRVYATAKVWNCFDLPDFHISKGRGIFNLPANGVATFIQK